MSKKSRKRWIVAFLLTLSLLVISGCQHSPTSEEGDVHFRRGSRGLEMRFIQDMPPHTIYEGDVLNIGIDMFNRGAAPIDNSFLGTGEIFVTGYDPDIIDNQGRFQTGNLPIYGTPEYFEISDYKTQYNDEGGYTTINLYSNEIDLPHGTDVYEIPLTVYACYPYETIASGSICIDPQPHRRSADKPCETRSESMGGTQGAPVGVTHLDVKNMRDQVRLVFSISNVGGGDLMDIESFYDKKCPTNFELTDYNKVDIEYVKVGNMDITGECDFVNPVTLYNGNGKIVCTHQIGGTTAYTTPVEIGIVYAYRDYIHKNIRIKNVD